MLIKKYFSQITSIMITCILLIYAFMHKSIFLLNVEYPYVWIGTEILLLAGILFFPFLKEKKKLQLVIIFWRSEVGRVGKEWRFRWWADL